MYKWQLKNGISNPCPSD